MTPTDSQIRGPGADTPAAEATTLLDVWRQSRPTVQGDLGLIESAVIAAGAGRLEPELRADARRCIHKLGGLVAMLGFLGASATACELEREIAGEAEPSLLSSLFASLRLRLAEETAHAFVPAEPAR